MNKNNLSTNILRYAKNTRRNNNNSNSNSNSNASWNNNANNKNHRSITIEHIVSNNGAVSPRIKSQFNVNLERGFPVNRAANIVPAAHVALNMPNTRKNNNSNRSNGPNMVGGRKKKGSRKVAIHLRCNRNRQ